MKELDFEKGELKHMITKGKELWKVDVPFCQEYSMDTDAVASYDFLSDTIIFHLKFVAKASKMYPDLMEELIRHAILHELGHAKEARIYSENGLFPYSINYGFPVNEPTNHFTERFFQGVEDYKIDKKLLQNGHGKPRDSWLLSAVEEMKRVVQKFGFNSDLERTKEEATAYFNMPLSICHFKLTRPLNNEEKRIIKSYYLKFLGNKRWKETLAIFETLRFGDVNNVKKVVPLLFNAFLGRIMDIRLHMINVPKKSWESENKCTLPDFWKKRDYLFYRVSPTKGYLPKFMIET